MLLENFNYRLPAKLILVIIIIQIMALGQLSVMRGNFLSDHKQPIVSIHTICPKAELQTKVAQQLCQNHLNFSLNSALLAISFFSQSSAFIALADLTTHYKLLVYSIFKPPKN